MFFNKHVLHDDIKSEQLFMHTNYKNRECKDFQTRPLLYLFVSLTSPILSYGCEIWSNNYWVHVEAERVHPFILRQQSV